MRGVLESAKPGETWGNVLRCRAFDPDMSGACRACGFVQRLHKPDAIFDGDREDRLAFHDWLKGKLQFPDSSSIGVLFSMIDEGWSVWARERGDIDVQPTGGIVVKLDEQVIHGDTFRTFDVIDFRHGRPRFRSLEQEEIDPESVQIPNSANIRSAARRLQEIASRHKGAIDSYQLRLTQTALALAELVA